MSRTRDASVPSALRKLLRVAYIVNRYPAVSHSFIRREILALERQGFEVDRISLRGGDDVLPDPQDEIERRRTRVVLQQGHWGLIRRLVGELLASPGRFVEALLVTTRLARGSDRSCAHPSWLT